MRNEQKLEEFLERPRKVTVNARGSLTFKRKGLKREGDILMKFPLTKQQKTLSNHLNSALDMIKQQMIDRFSSHRDILRSFQCLMPERLLNQSPEENRSPFPGIWS